MAEMTSPESGPTLPGKRFGEASVAGRVGWEHTNAMVKPHVAIVGAGPGGLAAAMLAARAGAAVTVHEKQARLGGRSGTIVAPTAVGEFRFDIGPTFFLYPAILEEIFASCGLALADHVDLVRLGTRYDLHFEDGPRLRVPADLAGLLAEIARLSPADAARIPAFMAENRRKLERFKLVLAQAFDGPRDLFSPAMLRSLPLLRPFSSVDADLARHFSDPRVRLAFSFQSKYLGMSPYRCPSLFTILAFMEHEYGIFHPRGGTGAVMAAMAKAAERLGAEIRLGDPVEEVVVESGRATGVRTADGVTRADAVMINADFARAMRTLVRPSARRRWNDAAIDRKKFSCSTFMLYLGLEGTLPETAHHTILLAADFARNFAEIETAAAPPDAPSIYVQNAAVTDPSVAPPGHSTLYVLVPVGNRDLDHPIEWTPELVAHYRGVALRRLQAAGIPDIESRIRFERIVTPTDWEEEFDVHRGAVFNLAHNIGQLLHWRPHNRFEDVGRLYLLGGGTHPGSGLPVIFEGARISTRLLASDLGLAAPGTALPVPPPDADALLEAAQ